MISDALFSSSTFDTTYLTNNFRYLHLSDLTIPANIGYNHEVVYFGKKTSLVKGSIFQSVSWWQSALLKNYVSIFNLQVMMNPS